MISYEIGKRLVKKGYKFNLVTVNPGSLSHDEALDGLNVHRIRGNILAHAYVPKIIKQIKPDIIVDDLGHAVPWFSPYFTDKPVVASFYHLHARSLPGQVNPLIVPILTFIEKQYKHVYNKSTFVTLSNTAVNDLLELGINKQNIVKILPGVNHNILKPSKKSEVPLLIYFAGMRDYKRPWMALELLNALRDKNFTLIVVGSGPSFLRVKETCKKYSLYNQVKFTGRLSYDELAELLGSSWINLHFSLTEGFGLSIVEAAACGTPTVALDAPGVSEVINEFGFGLVARDLDDMKNKIEEMLEDYSMWSRKVYENSLRFSWDKTAEDWDRLLKSLA